MIAAIYSRKSKMTETGESIDNQIELCKKYATDYLDKNIEFKIYEDEGFSGGNTNRPQFQQLLKDAHDKKFNVLICYRLDRISRNVADFSTTLQLLQNNSIDFVSIKEQFDTSTPMGRAMVYISSVFAQLERETIAERIRDNMYLLARSGRYMGGQVPLGFTTERVEYYDEELNKKHMSKLVRNEDELMKVELLYKLYIEGRSLHYVQQYCLEHHLKGKNGGQLLQRSIDDILRNPVYVKSNDDVFQYFKDKGISTVGTPRGQGLVSYGKRTLTGKKYDTSRQVVAVSNHKGIISAEKWLEVQYLLDRNAAKSSKRSGTSKSALLGGLLKCAKCGGGMRITYNRANKKGERGYHYTCVLKCHSAKTRCDNPNVNGPNIERAIINSIKSATKEDILEAFMQKYNRPPLVEESDKKNLLLKQKDSKTKQIDNLLEQLSNASGTASDFIMKKVNLLSDEIEKLNAELKKIESEVIQVETETLNIEIIYQNISQFKSSFDMLPHDRKKQLLNKIIEKITWNGETFEIDIDYLI